MSDTAIQQETGADKVFVRRSSGLTRQVSAWDALMFAAMGPGLTVNLIYLMWTAYLYPGIHYPASIITILLMFPISALYWLFSVAMPRSGGEYVYVTRTVHPAIGLMCSFLITITIASAVGFCTDWAVTYGIGDGFAALGIATGSSWATGVGDFLWTQWGRMIVGTALEIIMFYVWLRGTKWVMKMSWSVVVITLGMLVLMAVVVIAGGGKEGFITSWNATSGTNYNDIVNFASNQGYVIGFTMLATIMGGLTYVSFNTLGATFSANIAGEVRGVQKSQMIALFGALTVEMVVWYVGVQIVYSAIGGEFNSALNNILHSSPDAYPAILGGREPFITLMLGFFTSNPVILIGFGLVMAYTIWMIGLGLGFAMLRNVFAWSFDRIIPAKFAELDRRYRSPWLTVITYSVVGEIFLIGYIWTPQYMSFAGFFIIAWFIAWIFLGVAGIMFPYRHKELYESAPPLVKSKFLGVPVIVILGAATLAISLAIEVFMFIPFIQGLNDWRGLITVGIFIVLPFIIYYISKAYHAKSAVPLEMQFASIPPE